MTYNKQKQIDWFPILTLPPLLACLVSGSVAGERTIEEVIVTAQKREQGLIDVPASVSVVGGELASEAALVDAQDMVQYTPNVKFNSNNSNPVLSIRGFGTPPLARNIEPSVGIVINDVYYGRATFTNDGAFDMERVEVLRGPQGTLFGKNTVSGVLNFTTRAPATEPVGYINVANGSLNERRIEGGLSFPLLSDKVGARLSFRTRERETGNYNTTLDKELKLQEESFRLRMAWDASDWLALGLDYFQTESEVNGYGLQYQKATPRAAEVYREADPQFEDDVYNGKSSADSDEFNKRNSQSLTLNATAFFKDVGPIPTLEVALIANAAEIRSPFLLDSDFSPVQFSELGTDGPEGFEQKSLELRFTGDLEAPFGWGRGIDFATGLFAYQSDAAATQFSTIYYDGLEEALRAGQGGMPAAVAPVAAATLISADRAAAGDPNKDKAITRNVSALKNTSHSAFAQFTWYLTDRMDLTLGTRYGEEDKEGITGSKSDSAVIARQIGGQQDFFESYDANESDLSPKLAFSWEVWDDVRLFTVVSKGTKGGGVSGPLISPIDTTYDKETAVSKEIGIKSFLLDKTLQLNLTAYHVDYKNLQVQAFNGIQFTTVNAAAAVGKGFELDFQWLPDWQALTVAGSLGVSDTTYDSYPCAPGTATQTTDSNPSECGTEIPRQDLTGREVPYAPKISASLYPSLKFPISDQWGVLIGLDILHQGEHYLDIDLDREAFQEATTKVNLRLGLKQFDNGLSVVINAKNLTSEQSRTIFLDSPRNAGNYVALAEHSDPTYTLDVRYTFGEN
ncbi:TonB-dependent receptor [Spongiibacter sp. KMU-166]|uniref:TonB-dependent receptor n=1 Tax=Spongiibacter thalassae TaxID=2721624 RepID=A0ABX1GE21_9GAMM|nr:TonB-dependent receptor [Spongiibacter thalassae]NKI16713.1 TonB-dependent receptor [Spongiibacter thalassae]